jgi:hypothetical protein
MFFIVITSSILLSNCSQLDLLEAVRTSRKDIDLGPRPGPKIRSGVITPKREVTLVKPSDNEQSKDPESPCDSDNEEDEMPDKLATKSQVVEKMIDLDEF